MIDTVKLQAERRARIIRAAAVMSRNGFQAWLARKTGTCKVDVSKIFNGRRACTPKQAALWEMAFAIKDIPLNRWDLLYGYEAGQPNSPKLVEYLESKARSKAAYEKWNKLDLELTEVPADGTGEAK